MLPDYRKGDTAVDINNNKTYEIIDIYKNGNGRVCYLFKNTNEYYEEPFEVQHYRMNEYKLRRCTIPKPPKQLNKELSLTVELDSTEAYSKLEQIEQKLYDIKKLHAEVFNG